MSTTTSATCPSCKSTDLHPKASRCPHCGQQIRRGAHKVGVWIGVILAAILAGWWIAAFLTGNVQ